ncbi:MAG: hypothetical protein GF408_05755 [Candidatus Omnitrophica bacterium]|nr:hypothetical protein [Candidatus Omnitrophota bacterium]
MIAFKEKKLLDIPSFRIFLVLAAVLAVYWKGMNYFFEGDDYSWLKLASVTENPIRFFDPFYKPLWYETHFFRPVPRAVFDLVHGLAGMEPFPYHLMNLFLHMANVALLYRFVRSLSNDGSAAIVAVLIFAFHFEHFAGVIWIANLHSLVMVSFGLLMLTNWSVYLRNGGKRAYSGSMLFFLLAGLSKEVSVASLLLLAAAMELIFFPDGENRFSVREFARKYIPMVLIALLVFGLFYAHRYPFEARFGYGFKPDPLGWMATALRMLQLLIVETYTPRPLKAFISLVFVAVLIFSFFTFRNREREMDRFILFGAVWISLNAVIISFLAPAAAHYCYYMSIGLGLFLGGIASAFSGRKEGMKELGITVLAVLLLFSAWKMRQKMEAVYSGKWYRSLISQMQEHLPTVADGQSVTFIADRDDPHFFEYRLNGLRNPLELHYGKTLDIKVYNREKYKASGPGEGISGPAFSAESDIRKDRLVIEPLEER